jgi:hypothetical protein
MAISSDTIDHVTLQHLVEAGAVKGADVVGQPGGWGIVIKYGMTERALAARRGAIRIFSRFETLVNYLKNIGISQFNVNASNYDSSDKRSRPDSSERMKRTFDAADHNKWFREQVENGIQQANDPKTMWVSNEEAQAMSIKRRTEWAKQAKGRVA